MSKEKKEGWKSLSAGAIAGAIDTCITMPLDTAKTQMQLKRYGGLVDCAKKIVAANGVQGLYFGFRPFLLQCSGKSAVRFFAYDTLTYFYRKSGFYGNPIVQSVFCGVGAGMAEALIWTTPTERLKILRQALAAEGKTANQRLPPSALDIFRTEGISGLYVGAIPTAARQATSVAIRFTFVDLIKKAYKPENSNAPTPVLSFFAGGSAGAISVIVNNPIDVVKSKIQAGYKGGIINAIKEIQEKRGFRAWGAGLSARIPRLFISQAVQFTVFEQVMFLFDDYTKVPKAPERV